MKDEQLVTFKAMQKEGWGLFAPLEVVTTMTAATLVKFAEVNATHTVLDVGCGTGVAAITAARLGAKVSGLDLSPVLIERARANVIIACVTADMQEGDAEALPYPDQSFDAVISQFGHMFAPRPAVATAEMLRVLKPGGIIAFSTWPPALYMGRLFDLVREFFPAPAGVPSPSLWGDPNFVTEQLGSAVENLVFDQGLMQFPALSVSHYRQFIETTLGPVAKLISESQNNSDKLNAFRARLESLASPYFSDNYVRQHYLLSRARKKL